MTAFVADVVALLVLAFVVGLILGLVLRRRGGAGRAARGSPRQPGTEAAPAGALREAAAPLAASAVPPVSEVAFDGAAAGPSPSQPPVPAADDGHPGVKPRALAAPEGGRADDLKVIKGIGPQNERRLNGLGIFHLSQIAAWTPEEARWVGSYLAFPGRIEREDWIGQAKARLAAGPDAEPHLPLDEQAVDEQAVEEQGMEEQGGKET